MMQVKLTTMQSADVRDKNTTPNRIYRQRLDAPAVVGLTLSEMVMNKDLTFDISAYRLDRKPDVEKYVI